MSPAWCPLALTPDICHKTWRHCAGFCLLTIAGVMPERCVLLHSMPAFRNQRRDVLRNGASVSFDVLYNSVECVCGGWLV